MKKLFFILAMCCCFNVLSAKKVYCMVSGGQRGPSANSLVSVDIAGEYPLEIENLVTSDPMAVICALSKYGYEVSHHTTGDVGGSRIYHYYILCKEVDDNFNEYSYRQVTLKN